MAKEYLCLYLLFYGSILGSTFIKSSITTIFCEKGWFIVFLGFYTYQTLLMEYNNNMNK